MLDMKKVNDVIVYTKNEDRESEKSKLFASYNMPSCKRMIK